MMKNMEWGAVAYLSSSIYGRYTNSTTCISSGCEVWINNVYNSDLGSSVTGCSGASVSANQSENQTSCSNGYDWQTFGVNASTTGNQYGIYDMSGGEWEYVMGNMVNSSGSFYSSSSGFSVAPDAKYYNSYAYDASSFTTHARGLLGDATKETLKAFGSSDNGSWYLDNAYFPCNVASSSWFSRGGFVSSGNTAGVFDFSFGNGAGRGFRSAVSAQ
jgi:hypothetical protein